MAMRPRVNLRTEFASSDAERWTRSTVAAVDTTAVSNWEIRFWRIGDETELKSITLTAQPEERLTNGIIANNLFDLRLGWKHSPQFDVFGAGKC